MFKYQEVTNAFDPNVTLIYLIDSTDWLKLISVALLSVLSSGLV